MPKPLCIILNYRKLGKYALNVITGTLDTQPRFAGIPVIFAKSDKQLIEAITENAAYFEQVLVAWSFYSPSFTESCELLAKVKQQSHFANVTHIAGGVHATAEPEQTLRAGFDLVAVGEGEQIFVDLVTAILDDTPMTTIRGIAHLDDDDNYIRGGKGEYVDLNDYPPFAQKYRRFNPIEITRGCIYACSFCQTPFVNKAKFRHRSITNIVEHVIASMESGLQDFRFVTPTALSYGTQDESVNIDAIETLLASIRAVIGPERRLFFGTFPSEIRPEHVTAKNLAVLKKYVDNDNIIIGGQSGSNRMLEKIHRGHDVGSVRNAVAVTLKAGFKANVDFLFGMPGETLQDAEQTRQFAKELADMGARIHTHTFMPLPGTPMRRLGVGEIDDETQATLHALSSSGQAYGQWENQIAIAHSLTSKTMDQNG